MKRLKQEYTQAEFKNLFECEFMDESGSVFSIKKLQACVENQSAWKDFEPDAERPFGDKHVWIGFDPSRSLDKSTCVVLAPPASPKDKFRLLEKYHWQGENFQTQANHLKWLCQRFNVRELAIDSTGIGLGVFELTQHFFPRVNPIHYSTETKNQLVVKAQNIIDSGRIQWDGKHHIETSQSFLMIKKRLTQNGQVVYGSDRTQKSGHADTAFAIMHALYFEPFDAISERRASVVV